MTIAVQDLLAVPDLPLKMAAARRALDLEAEQRERFRDEIQPHDKAEFINGETIEQYVLAAESDTYRLAEKLAHGDIKPVSFPELAVPLAALFEEAANLEFLRTLLK